MESDRLSCDIIRQACKVREINLFAAGDSNDIKTWSNVPYFFSGAVEQKGIRVNRINLIPDDMFLYRWYMRFFLSWSALKRMIRKKDYPYDFFRDRISLHLSGIKARRALRRHPDADFNIFLTFSISSYRYSDIPVIHYCDQTYDLYLSGKNRAATERDRVFIAMETGNLKNARYIFTTGRRCCEHIVEKYGLVNVRSLPAGINLDTLEIADEAGILAGKMRERNILFIGKGIHKRGVDILIEAFTRFSGMHAESWKLHIVGVDRESFGELPGNIFFYGQLSKDIPAELACYLHLMRSARLFVMPMRKGPLPGVVKEVAMMYTPSIITDIWHASDLVSDGYNGKLVGHADAGEFAQAMDELVSDEKAWERLARNAHGSMQRFTWSRSIDQMLEVIAQDMPVDA